MPNRAKCIYAINDGSSEDSHEANHVMPANGGIALGKPDAAVLKKLKTHIYLLKRGA